MERKRKEIPEKDLEVINESFKTGESDTIAKDADGNRVSVDKKVVNETSISLKDFSRRILKHQKSIFYPNKGMVVVGVKGDKFSDIPLERRNLVTWLDSDFE